MKDGTGLCSAHKTGHRNQDVYVPLTPNQEVIWFEQKLFPKTPIYNIGGSLLIKGKIDPELFNKALNIVIHQNDALRIVIREKDGKPCQEFLPHLQYQTDFIDLSHKKAPRQSCLERMQTEFQKPLDMTQAPLFQSILFKESDTRYRWFSKWHHIITDGWGTGLQTQWLADTYNNLLENKPRPERFSYKDYVLKELDYMGSETFEKNRDFWMNTFSTLPEPLLTPLTGAANRGGGENGPIGNERETIVIEREQYDRLGALCKENKSSIYHLFAGLLYIYFSRTTGNGDMVIGLPVLNRSNKIFKQTFGLFTGVSPLRIDLGPEATLGRLLRFISTELRQIYRHQRLPITEINKSPQQGKSNRQPLHQLELSYEKQDYNVRYAGHETESDTFSNNFRQTPLSVFIREFSSVHDVHVDFDYNLAYFDETAIKRVAGHFSHLLETIFAGPGFGADTKIRDIDLLTPAEKHRLLVEFNDTRTGYPADKSIVQLFEEQVLKYPHHIALAAENNEWLTYRELDRESNRLAHVLKEKSVRPGDIVAIMGLRSPRTFVGIFAILKTGAAYLPVDPAYPAGRRDYMLADSGVKVMPAPPDTQLPGHAVEIVDFSRPAPASPFSPSLSTPFVSPANPSSPAYVIYTSGSTGRPKGTLIEHRGISNLLAGQQKVFLQQPSDNMLQFASLSFDASVYEMFTALLGGASLVIIGKEAIEHIPRFIHFVNRHKVSMMLLPPAYLARLEKVRLPYLRILHTGGEAAIPEDAAYYSGYTRFINCYGPTEATILCTYSPLANYDASKPVTIGKPIANTRIYLLNKDGCLVPPGTPGEICIASPGLARGYLNRPELTHEKFVVFPASAVNSELYTPETVYKTGDLGRWLEDGNIEFLGRIDHQVKIRGFRIEPGEIEQQLQKNPAVKNALVLLHKNEEKEKSLCAFVEHASAHAPEKNELRRYLGRTLPNYMVPAMFVFLEEFPLTANGKVDGKALAQLAVTAQQPGSGKNYIAPRNGAEETLAQTWRQVLGREKIGIHDNFFDCGGDSIKAIQISSRLQDRGLKLEIKDLFESPTLAEAALKMKKAERRIPRETVSGDAGLTPVQQWFFENNGNDLDLSAHFNHAVMLYAEKGFNETFIQKAFTKLLHHHDALRMTYHLSENQIRQHNREIEGKLFDLDVFPASPALSPEDMEKEVNRIQCGINLETGPLVKLGLFETAGGHHLLIVIHHLVIDGVSWRILLEDFQTAYRQLEKGEAILLPDKTDSFLYWSAQQALYAESSRVRREPAYWTGIMESPAEPLPVDTPVSERIYKDNRDMTIDFTPGQTRRLLHETNHAFNTEINDILLTVLAVSLERWRGITKTHVNLEGHGREFLGEDIRIDRTVGWFTTQYPVFLDISQYHDPADRICHIKETLRRVPNKGIGFGMLRYLSSHGEPLRDFAHPLIGFNYLGDFGNNQRKNSFFQFSPLGAGQGIAPEMNRHHALEINGMVKNGTLGFTFSYNTLEFREDSVRRLAELFRAALLEIAGFCAQRKERVSTPSDYGDKRLSLERLDALHTLYGPGHIEKIHPLSPMQEGMLFHYLQAQQPHAYFEQSTIDLEGHLDISRLEQSLNHLIHRHDILRTAFVYEGLEAPAQVVLKQRPVPLLFIDLSAPEAQETQEETTAAYKQEEKGKRFDLTHDPLVRFALFKTGAASWRFIWSFHHIILDGWCLGIFFKELVTLLQSHGAPARALPDAPPPYKTYIDWLREQDVEEGLQYWRDYLEDYETLITLPGKRKNPAPVNTGDAGPRDYRETAINLAPAAAAPIHRVAGRSRVTLNTLIQCAWALLLQRYNNTHDVVYGSVVSGRSAPIRDIENMMGLFINTVPVRITSTPGQTFAQLMQEVRDREVHSKSREYLPLADVQALSPLKGNLISHVMVFENYPIDAQLKNMAAAGTEKGFAITGAHADEQVHYDFGIMVIPGDDTLGIRIHYDAGVYDEAALHRTAGHLRKFLDDIALVETQPLKDIDILTAPEKQRLLLEFNDTRHQYPDNQSIIQLFEEQVEKHPHHIALTHVNGEFLTFRRLNREADRLAHTLKGKSVRPGDLVAIMGLRSPRVFVGLLAILKTGAAYVPVDPTYPGDRIAYILKDSAVSIMLAPPDTPLPRCGVETVDFSPSAGDVPFVSPAGSSSPAYVIYTSGSTGRPKGTLIEHRSITNIIAAQQRVFQQTPDDNVLQFASLSFDASVYETFMAFLGGASLVLIDRERGEHIPRFIEYVNKKRVSIMALTPAFIARLEKTPLPYLRVLHTGGETAIPEDIAYYSRGALCINCYGPTETTILCTYSPFNDFDPSQSLPIGKPIANTRFYILNKDGRLVPPGAPGELCIGGPGLAAGYLNKPELTAEKFVTLPGFAVDGHSYPGETIYKTGDLGRWLEEGNLEFLGRIDHQVKIRGFRIELGEIEQQLQNHASVKNALLMIRERKDREKYLCAFLEHTPGSSPDAAQMREYLGGILPNYMIPSMFVFLETFPINASGKLDRGALARLAGSREQSGGAGGYEAPRTPMEETLARIWGRVLGREQVGIHDNFFDCGGHSLKATRVVSAIYKETGREIPLGDLFQNPTIAQLAPVIRPQEDRRFADIPPVEEREYYPVSNAQRRLWVLSQFEESNAGYNMPGGIMLEGSLDREALETAFKTLIRRHETLRTHFASIGGQPVQVVRCRVDFSIPLETVETEEVEDHIEAFSTAPFDLTRAPLFRVKLLKTGEQRHVLLFNMHHIISDGWSMNIFISEFLTLYKGLTLSPPAAVDLLLPPLRLQYKDYTQWQTNLSAGEQMAAAGEYWRKQMEPAGDNGLPLLNLPADYPRPSVKSYDGDALHFSLEPPLTAGINRLSKERGVTLFMFLLAAVDVLLSRYSGQEDIIVGSPIAGRNHPGLEDQVGFYVNTLALRGRVDGGRSFETFLDGVGHTTVRAYENQNYPFDKLVDELDLERELNRNPLFDVLVVLQNNDAAQLEFPGLRVTRLDPRFKVSKFDVMFNFAEEKGGVETFIEYSTDLFRPGRILRMRDHFTQLVRSLCVDSTRALNRIDFLSPQEKHHLLVELNDTGSGVPLEKTVVELFARQVEKNPYRLALVGSGDEEGRCLTYRQLDREARRTAGYLTGTHGVGRGDIVAVNARRGIRVVTALLGILKAGAAYLPVDPGYPEERRDYILNDSDVRVFLTDALFDIIEAEDSAAFPVGPAHPISLSHPSYIIYTSGSTGRPKGVAGTHRCLANLIQWQMDRFHSPGSSGEGMVTALYSALNFDVSVQEMLYCTCSGGTLHIVPDDVKKDPDALLDFVHDREIELLTMPFSALNLLFYRSIETGKAPALKHIITSGEQLQVTVNIRQFLLNRPHVQLHNQYGPSETHVVSNHTLSTPLQNIVELPPIGRPIDGTGFYILDSRMNLQPPGVPGELYLGGVNLALGYLNNPEKTAESFVPCDGLPFEPPAERGEFIYKTGDLARWLPDGTVEFLGRKDHQVKIRGFRIELGEIETRLLTFPAVKETAVIARPAGGGKNELAAFIVFEGPETQTALPTVEELRTYLGRFLPDYMIPAYFITMETLPVTASGKVNKKELLESAPRADMLEQGREYAAPRNETEEKLVNIWQTILGREKIGIHDDFFHLGGHSLSAMKLVSEIARETGIEIPLAVLYKASSVVQQAELLDNPYMQGFFDARTNYITYNPGAPADLFVFPPVLGYGTVFSGPAQMVTTHSWHCFDYIDSPDRLEQYADQIIRLCDKGDYILMGYSAGGKLAFDVAAVLERRGKTVSGIIIIDAFPNREPLDVPFNIDENRHVVDLFFQEAGLTDALAGNYLESKILKEIENYYNYMARTVQTGKISAGIHLLRSISQLPNPNSWRDFTHRGFKTYQGSGEHLHMLVGENLPKNVDIIRRILGGTAK